MTILALEFSSDRRGVAVIRDGTVLSSVVHEGTRETPIFRLISRAIDEAGVRRGDIGRLAVGLGPGSYTGIRLAISVAQGWQLANEVETVGIGSLEVMASVAGKVAGGGALLLAVDSQRNEFAVAEALGGRLIGPLRLVGLEEIRSRITGDGAVAGPDESLISAGARPLFPDAAILGQLAADRPPIPSETLSPVYLRDASFAKAPPVRKLESRFTDPA